MAKLTARDLVAMKKRGEKITMVTAYDYPIAYIADKVGIDVLLVGDSAAMVVLGQKDTRAISLEEMLVFCKAVSRAAERAFVVGDMPFLSYQVSIEQAVLNAGRMVKEGGVDAVKLEGGEEIADVVKAIVKAGIPTMGHIGVNPQRDVSWSGYRLKGKRAEEVEKLLEDALALEEAGAFSIVVEFATEEAAKVISRKLSIPVIGVGAGAYCDGQCLVVHDILGLYPNRPPFSKAYVNLSEIIRKALEDFRSEVCSGLFPVGGYVFHMDEKEMSKLPEELRSLIRNGTNPSPRRT